MDNVDVAFPILPLEHVVFKTSGTYQVKLAPAYIQDTAEKEANDEYIFQLQQFEPGLLRAKIISRSRSQAVKYSLFISYSLPPIDYVQLDHITGNYCTCKVGARTFRVCAHVASVASREIPVMGFINLCIRCCKLGLRDSNNTVVDPSSEEILGPNQRGELRLKSDLFMNGYYKMDSSSAYDSQGYLRTGDIVLYDEDECIYVVDRVKEMFKYRGWHILPAVVEEVLMTHPAVKEAVVIGIPHEIDGEHPMGIVVLHEGYKDVIPNEIEQFVEERVDDTQRLRAGVKIIKTTVRTATEKIQRNAMKKMVLDGLI